MIHLKQGEFVGSLDCGTSSVRFIVFDEHAKIIASFQDKYPQSYPKPGWHDQDAENLIHACEKCINEACAQLEKNGWAKQSVKVVGTITNQRETTVVWRKSTGVPLCQAIVWSDMRTKGTVTQFAQKLADEGIELEPGVFKKGPEGIQALKELTGLRLSTYFSAIKLRYLLDSGEHPEVKIAYDENDLLFGTLDSWIIYRLIASERHITEVSNASRTLLMNARTLQWDDALLRFFDIKPSILPTIVSSSEVYGTLARGALAGVRVAGLIGDQQGALVGNRCLQKGDAKCTYGTGAFMLVCTGDEFQTDKHELLSTVAYQNGPDNDPVYALEGSIAAAGSVIKWLREKLQILPEDSAINTLAEQVEDSGGVYFVTAFSGLLAPYWDPNAAGMLVGLSAHTSVEHIARATLEANAFHTHAILREAMSPPRPSGFHLKVDGGVTKGDTAMKTLADILGEHVMRPAMQESTALGSALLAGSAVGLFGWDVGQPETLLSVSGEKSKVFEPQMDGDTRSRHLSEWDKAIQLSCAWDKGIMVGA